MRRNRRSIQMFALPGMPPKELVIAGEKYELLRVFKHDFFAATCLYRACGEAAAIAKIVVKFYRTQPFLALPCRWMGELLADHEEAIYRALAGVPGVPRWVSRLDRASYAIEYIDAPPLDHLAVPPPGFFDRLRVLFDAIHARGVGYCDANKRSNILVGEGGEPFLVDYQISVRLREDWPWPLRAIQRAIVRYVAEKDLYHLYKHKRRLCPEELTEEEEALSRRREGWHLLHRKLTKPWRTLRRRFLRREYQNGRLVSPTAELEDHDQPEKATWRIEKGKSK